MVKYLLATHGNFCDGILNTLEIFVSNTSNVTTIPFYVDGADSETAFNSFISDLADEDTVIVLTDILFGSINQKVMTAFAAANNVHVITGLNLPLLLELFTMNEDDITKESIEQKVNSSKNSIIYMNTYEIESLDGDE